MGGGKDSNKFDAVGEERMEGAHSLHQCLAALPKATKLTSKTLMKTVGMKKYKSKIDGVITAENSGLIGPLLLNVFFKKMILYAGHTVLLSLLCLVEISFNLSGKPPCFSYYMQWNLLRI